MSKPGIVERLYGNCIRNSSGCLVWLGKRTPKGYGTISWNGKRQYVHRVSLALHKGTSDLFAMHTCGVRTCIEPSHLEYGTHAGEASVLAKLTDASVMAIRTSSETHAFLARRYGVGKKTISYVKNLKTWKHL